MPKTTRMFKFFKIMKDREYIYVKLYKSQEDNEPMELNNTRGSSTAKNGWKNNKDTRRYFQKLKIYELSDETKK